MATNRVSPKKGKVVDIPDATITIGTPTAGNAQASVAFTASSPATGGPVQKYTAVSNPGSFTGTASSSPVTVSGLTNGTAYTFTVAASNATGNGVFSSASTSVTPIAPTDYESIATITLGSGGASNVTFSSIPSTYKHLQIRCIAKTTRASFSNDNLKIQFNSDTASNYYSHNVYGDGSGTGGNAFGWTAQYYGGSVGAQLITNNFGAAIIDIIDYSNTNKFKVSKILAGFDNNNTGTDKGIVALNSGHWRSTSAITSVIIGAAEGSGLQEFSTFALYGIKG